MICERKKGIGERPIVRKRLKEALLTKVKLGKTHDSLR